LARDALVDSERILITVRTYPNVSSKYIETVCTGGINDRGEWRRLVPVPLRYLEEEQQYRAFDVVTVKLGPGKDGRPETRTPHLPSLKVEGSLKDWGARCEWVNPTIAPSLQALEGAGRTLGPVAVHRVVEIRATRVSSDWTPQQKQKMRQADLFHERKPLAKIPYDFHVVWEDTDGVQHKSLVMAWEMLETYRQYRRRYEQPTERMRAKWMSDLFGPSRRVSFFMGNLAKRRKVFGICGWFVPPKEIADGGVLW
jgi:hypothetical protein